MMKQGVPVRVLYLEASIGGVVGGSLTGLQHLLRGLDRRFCEPIVVLYERKSLQAELETLQIPVRIVDKKRRARNNPLRENGMYQQARKHRIARSLFRSLQELQIFFRETLPAALSLVRIIKETKPDLIHLCNSFRGNLDGIVAAWLMRVPCVCHVKGFAKYGWLDRLFARTVDLGICMTGAVHRHCASERVSAKHMTVIYDGLDVEGFRPSTQAGAVRRQLGIPAGAPLVGIIGNIQAWKGHAVVVEAINEVRSVLPEIRCLIVGGVHRNGAQYAADINRFVQQHGLQSNVIFTGFRDDVADLVAALDVVIHASVTPEPFGRVILEAMTLGKPVIATNIGGVPEFVQDLITGRLVPPGDFHALAAAIVELLGDSVLRERLGSNARHEVHQRFTMQRHVEEIAGAYASLGIG
ncbi:MAG: glycosyltransferase family 4 protein [Candidatus Binatia bacterium]